VPDRRAQRGVPFGGGVFDRHCFASGPWCDDVFDTQERLIDAGDRVRRDCAWRLARRTAGSLDSVAASRGWGAEARSG